MRRIFYCFALITWTIIINQFVQISGQDTAETQNIKNGVTEFAAKLNKILYERYSQQGNMMFSPLNVYAALSFLNLGLKGQTQQQINDAMGLPKSDYATHQAFGNILGAIEETTPVSIVGEHGREKVRQTEIKMTKGVFAQKYLTFKNTYKINGREIYHNEILKVDFANASDIATDLINRFIAENTKNRISQMFSTPLSSDTRLLVAAVLYFKGMWEDKFPEARTTEGTFNTGTDQIPALMMNKITDVPYINLPFLKAEAIGLKYAGGDATMYLLRPNNDQTLDKVVKLLDGDQLKQMVKESKPTYVNYTIPRTKFKWNNDLNDPLKELGIKALFSNDADFGNMLCTTRTKFKVSRLTHAADISLDEEGTEASAATTIKVVAFGGLSHPQPIQFLLNKPFLFLIFHHKTETPLFLGTVHNPNTA